MEQEKQWNHHHIVNSQGICFHLSVHHQDHIMRAEWGRRRLWECWERDYSDELSAHAVLQSGWLLWCWDSGGGFGCGMAGKDIMCTLRQKDRVWAPAFSFDVEQRNQKSSQLISWKAETSIPIIQCHFHRLLPVISITPRRPHSNIHYQSFINSKWWLMYKMKYSNEHCYVYI